MVSPAIEKVPASSTLVGVTKWQLQPCGDGEHLGLPSHKSAPALHEAVTAMSYVAVNVQLHWYVPPASNVNVPEIVESAAGIVAPMHGMILNASTRANSSLGQAV
jgi:hypothetical protein